MNDFFRKERPAIFTERFAAPKAPSNAWTLKSHLIFKCKNSDAKSFTVKLKVKGKDKKDTGATKDVKVQCTAEVHELKQCIVMREVNGTAMTIKAHWTEADMHTIVSDKANADTLEYLVIKKLFQDHTVSSSSSLLISGCTVNNFHASRTYPGNKLHLKLKDREPVLNPFVSGLERECFLIGEVQDTDCSVINYLGATEESINVLVNFYGSLIARPR